MIGPSQYPLSDSGRFKTIQGPRLVSQPDSKLLRGALQGKPVKPPKGIGVRAGAE